LSENAVTRLRLVELAFKRDMLSRRFCGMHVYFLENFSLHWRYYSGYMAVKLSRTNSNQRVGYRTSNFART